MFRDTLVKGIKQIYENDRNEVHRKSSKFVKDYFSYLEYQLVEEIEVSNGEVSFRIKDSYPYSMELNDKTLIIDMESESKLVVSVNHLDQDNFLEEIDTLIPNGIDFISANFEGKKLDNELMDIYLERAFKKEMLELLN
ncbi:hypothetical protein SAMN04487786_1109 [Paenisporosarcina quisquiliarum]|nr:hypothetical protein SAMN04487786_1109 [Paenisporosarcina quisquiliarum]